MSIKGSVVVKLMAAVSTWRMFRSFAYAFATYYLIGLMYLYTTRNLVTCLPRLGACWAKVCELSDDSHGAMYGHFHL